jgi:hypothetical protein
VSLENSLNKIPWVIVFVVGVQFHFLAIIFPEMKDYNIHVFGMSLTVISAALILILYAVKRRQQEKMSDVESLR